MLQREKMETISAREEGVWLVYAASQKKIVLMSAILQKIQILENQSL